MYRIQIFNVVVGIIKKNIRLQIFTKIPWLKDATEQYF